MFKGQIQRGETFQYLAEYKIMIIDLETFNTHANNQQIQATSKISKRIDVSNFINNVHFLPLYFYPSPPKKKIHQIKLTIRRTKQIKKKKTKYSV